MWRGFAMSVMSKIRIPRSRSWLTVSVTPCGPQCVRPFRASPDTNSSLRYTETSLCGPHSSTRRGARREGRGSGPSRTYSPSRWRTPRRTAPRWRTRRTENGISLSTPVEVVQHAAHVVNFAGLIGVHIGGEPEDGPVLGGPRGGEQLRHHRDGALVVLNHEREEQAGELPAARALRPGHLVGGQHAGHVTRAV